MSKKTRKKSPKPPSGKAARAVRSAKKPTSKTRKTKASRSGKKAAKPSAAATRGAFHKARSKQLKKTDAPTSKTVAFAVLAEGTKAPAFGLPRDGGETVALSDFLGKKLVLFFYPRADTPGCTREAIDFTRLSDAFAQNHTAVLGVSADPPRSQEAFRDKHQLKTPLASDEQHQMLEAYGVWGEKSMYGKTFLGIVRTTVLIGTDGRVIRIWRNVKVDGHAEEVLSAVQTL